MILDAGVAAASDAALAMEIGCDGVVCASTLSRAGGPVARAAASWLTVDAGVPAQTPGGSRGARPRA